MSKKIVRVSSVDFPIQIACLMPREEEFLNSIGRFRICLLSSTADSAQVWWKWAGLAVLLSRQILNQPIEFKNSSSQGIRQAIWIGKSTLEALTIFLLIYVRQEQSESYNTPIVQTHRVMGQEQVGAREMRERKRTEPIWISHTSMIPSPTTFDESDRTLRVYFIWFR